MQSSIKYLLPLETWKSWKFTLDDGRIKYVESSGVIIATHNWEVMFSGVIVPLKTPALSWFRSETPSFLNFIRQSIILIHFIQCEFTEGFYANGQNKVRKGSLHNPYNTTCYAPDATGNIVYHTGACPFQSDESYSLITDRFSFYTDRTILSANESLRRWQTRPNSSCSVVFQRKQFCCASSIQRCRDKM